MQLIKTSKLLCDSLQWTITLCCFTNNKHVSRHGQDLYCNLGVVFFFFFNKNIIERRSCLNDAKIHYGTQVYENTTDVIVLFILFNYYDRKSGTHTNCVTPAVACLFNKHLYPRLYDNVTRTWEIDNTIHTVLS